MLKKESRPKHPYVEFEGTALWKVVNEAIGDLEKNQDLKLTELPEYIVGYICKQLIANDLVDPRRG